MASLGVNSTSQGPWLLDSLRIQLDEIVAYKDSRNGRLRDVAYLKNRDHSADHDDGHIQDNGSTLAVEFVRKKKKSILRVTQLHSRRNQCHVLLSDGCHTVPAMLPAESQPGTDTTLLGSRVRLQRANLLVTPMGPLDKQITLSVVRYTRVDKDSASDPPLDIPPVQSHQDVRKRMKTLLKLYQEQTFLEGLAQSEDDDDDDDDDDNDDPRHAMLNHDDYHKTNPGLTSLDHDEHHKADQTANSLDDGQDAPDTQYSAPSTIPTDDTQPNAARHVSQKDHLSPTIIDVTDTFDHAPSAPASSGQPDHSFATQLPDGAQQLQPSLVTLPLPPPDPRLNATPPIRLFQKPHETTATNHATSVLNLLNVRHDDTNEHVVLDRNAPKGVDPASTSKVSTAALLKKEDVQSSVAVDFDRQKSNTTHEVPSANIVTHSPITNQVDEVSSTVAIQNPVPALSSTPSPPVPSVSSCGAIVTIDNLPPSQSDSGVRKPNPTFIKYAQRPMPKDQRDLLVKDTSWLPSLPNKRFPPSNVPIAVIKMLSSGPAAPRTSAADQVSDNLADHQTLDERPTSLGSESLPDSSPINAGQPPSSSQVSWSLTPSQRLHRRSAMIDGLPPDSSAPSPSKSFERVLSQSDPDGDGRISVEPGSDNDSDSDLPQAVPRALGSKALAHVSRPSSTSWSPRRGVFSNVVTSSPRVLSSRQSDRDTSPPSKRQKRAEDSGASIHQSSDKIKTSAVLVPQSIAREGTREIVAGPSKRLRTEHDDDQRGVAGHDVSFVSPEIPILGSQSQTSDATPPSKRRRREEAQSHAGQHGVSSPVKSLVPPDRRQSIQDQSKVNEEISNHHSSTPLSPVALVSATQPSTSPTTRKDEREEIYLKRSSYNWSQDEIPAEDFRAARKRQKEESIRAFRRQSEAAQTPEVQTMPSASVKIPDQLSSSNNENARNFDDNFHFPLERAPFLPSSGRKVSLLGGIMSMDTSSDQRDVEASRAPAGTRNALQQSSPTADGPSVPAAPRGSIKHSSVTREQHSSSSGSQRPSSSLSGDRYRNVRHQMLPRAPAQSLSSSVAGVIERGSRQISPPKSRHYPDDPRPSYDREHDYSQRGSKYGYAPHEHTRDIDRYHSASRSGPGRWSRHTDEAKAHQDGGLFASFVANYDNLGSRPERNAFVATTTSEVMTRRANRRESLGSSLQADRTELQGLMSHAKEADGDRSTMLGAVGAWHIDVLGARLS